MARTYRMSAGTAVYHGAFSLLWFGSCVYIAISLISDIHEFSAALIGVVAALILFGLVPAINMAYFVAYEVSLRDDEICEFRSLLRRRSIRVQQIRSISSDEDNLYIHHDRGKIHFDPMPDLEDLLNRLLELNPAITLEGWVKHDVPTRGRDD
jgi:hypothetical protein